MYNILNYLLSPAHPFSLDLCLNRCICIVCIHYKSVMFAYTFSRTPCCVSVAKTAATATEKPKSTLLPTRRKINNNTHIAQYNYFTQAHIKYVLILCIIYKYRGILTHSSRFGNSVHLTLNHGGGCGDENVFEWQDFGFTFTRLYNMHV